MHAPHLACTDSLTTELKPVMMCPGVLAVHIVQCYMQECQSSSSKLPICTIEPNVGIVAVPDDRLQVRPLLPL